MNLHHLGFFALVLALPAAGAATVEDRVEKTLTVEPGGQLVLEVDRGAIELEAAPGTNVVRIVAERKATAAREAKAREILENHRLEVSQEGNRVQAKGRLTKPFAAGWLFGSNFQVRYLVTVPQQFDATLETAGGSIRVEGPQGKVQARTSGGSLKFASVSGPLHGRTSGGSIEASQCTGSAVLETGGGGIVLDQITGDVKATTSGGSVKATRVTGPCVLTTSGGSMNLEDIRGEISARTSGGSVLASFAASPAADCRLETSGGSINVTLPKDAAVEVDAATSGGRVTTEFPVTSVVQGEAKSRHLQGTINGGGPKITARTSGGNIQFKAR